MSKETKVYPSKKSLMKTFIAYSLILLVIIYAVFSSRFAWAYKDPKDLNVYITQDVVSVAAWLVISIISYFILSKESYYILSNEELRHHRFNKDMVYKYDEILYIDEEYTKKHNTLLFYTDKGIARFLILDKEGKVLEYVHKYSNNLITREEFHGRFPGVKL